MKYIIKNNPQGSEEWLKDRLGHFTGSDAQAVANNGVGLQTLVYEKVAEILTGKSKESYTNDQMLRGQELEELGRNSLELELGEPIKEVGFLELNKYVGASVDGFIGDDSIFELKCPNDANFVKHIYEKKISSVYLWQMQHYLYVTERKYCIFGAYNPNFPKPLIITRVERNEDDIKKLVEGIEKGTEKIQEILASIKG